MQGRKLILVKTTVINWFHSQYFVSRVHQPHLFIPTMCVYCPVQPTALPLQARPTSTQKKQRKNLVFRKSQKGLVSHHNATRWCNNKALLKYLLQSVHFDKVYSRSVFTAPVVAERCPSSLSPFSRPSLLLKHWVMWQNIVTWLDHTVQCGRTQVFTRPFPFLWKWVWFAKVGQARPICHLVQVICTWLLSTLPSI